MAKEFLHSSYIKWCCEDMKTWIYDDRFPLDLDVSTRKFFLPVMWPHAGPGLRIIVARGVQSHCQLYK